jgi:hypothetical protein
VATAEPVEPVKKAAKKPSGKRAAKKPADQAKAAE